MTHLDRRRFLLATGATAASLPPVLAHALSIDASVRTGTIQDVEHVVILTQENRGFDHYFGSMAGVRGFGDRFPIPVADHPLAKGRTVWVQANREAAGRPPLIAPFALDTAESFALMRVEGTPHTWVDTQNAWDHGRMADWPKSKGEHALGHYGADDIPFQHALAEAFTICDAYHCSILGGTNPNRLYLWTGTNDPSGAHGGPVLSNSNDRFPEQGGQAQGYSWTHYVERLQAAGVSWRVYQDMADNFTDNPMAGFQAFRDSHNKVPGSDPRLAAEGLSTFKLDRLRADVLAGTLPAVSYVVAPAKDSEHPEPSSPAQGADFSARVIEALTADPKVWAKTVLFLMYDENDGFFDHAPPPAPPSREASGALAGASTVAAEDEYHLVPDGGDRHADRPQLMGRPYGLGPRVPMFVISPWSRGGWVNSEVFDHTSVLRFLEARFGVPEPNISAWRRAVSGDLVSAFDFKTPNAAPFKVALPKTGPLAAKAAALPGRTRPTTPAEVRAPVQAYGVRPSRPLGYDLEVAASPEPGSVRLTFANTGALGAVFHVYDRRRLAEIPRRYTVEAGKSLAGRWDMDADGLYDLWVLGPNGFHRHVTGRGAASAVVSAQARGDHLVLTLTGTETPRRLILTAMAYGKRERRIDLGRDGRAVAPWPTLGGWYDLVVRDSADPAFSRRFAGRLETGRPSTSDPAMGGPARMGWEPLSVA
jgi:phospholipase C